VPDQNADDGAPRYLGPKLGYVSSSNRTIDPLEAVPESEH